MADENLTSEEQIVQDYATYDTNYFTGSQVSLFLGPVWIEDFVSIRWQMRNSKSPVYGYNELYSDMDISGKFLVEGSLTVNFRETDYLQRLILQIQQAIENQPDKIDDIIESQKGKFRTRIENRLLQENSGDASKVAALIEEAKTRLNVLVNELSNQEENIFNFELTVVAGNYRSGADDSAIKIFEGFTISDEIGQSEPDDTPLYTTYRWYARKSRSRITKPQVVESGTAAPIDVKRMIDEICDKLVNGFGLDNKKTLLKLLTEKNSVRPAKLTLFDVAGSGAYAKEKKRGLIDIPYIEFINKSTELGSNDLTKDIESIDKIGHTGLVKVGTNNYGYKANINKYVIRYSCPIIFDIEQPVYEFELDPLTNTILFERDSKPIDKSGSKLTSTIATGTNVFNYPLVLDNTSGKLQYIDHEKMGYEGNGFELIGQIMPSPPSSRGAGIPTRSFLPDAAYNIKTVTPKTFSSFTNSFLSTSEPITVLKQRKNYFKSKVNNSGSSDANTESNEETIEEIVSMPLNTTSYYDWTKLLGYNETSKLFKTIKPIPFYYVNRYITEQDISTPEAISAMRKGDFSTFENSNDLKGFVGTEGVDFAIVPLEQYSYVGSLLDFIGTDELEDFIYRNYNLKELIKTKYNNDLLNNVDFANRQKSLHIFPVVVNIEDYIKQKDQKDDLGNSLDTLFALQAQRNIWVNGASEGKVLQDILKLLSNGTSNISTLSNIYSDIHYDYLFKNTSGMTVAGITKEIEFSMITKVDPLEELKGKDDIYNYYIQFFCIVSTIPSIPRKPIVKQIDKVKTKYSLVNYKGLSTTIDETKESPTATTTKTKEEIDKEQNGRLSDYDKGFGTLKPLTYNSPTAPVVEYEVYIRSDLKHYDVQDSAIDTFINSIGSLFGIIKWKNIVTYMKEFKTYVNQSLDPEANGLKEWLGYFKQTFVGLIEPFIKISDFFSPMVSTFGQEEKVVVQNLNNIVGFNREVYLTINLRAIAQEIYKYFDKNQFPTGTGNVEGTRKTELNNTRNNSKSNNSSDKTLITATQDFSGYLERIEKDFSSNNGTTKAGTNRLIERIASSTSMIIGTEESFITFVAETLRKKIGKFNVTENNSIEIRNHRFGTDPTAKIIRSIPQFNDPTKLDFLYIKLKNTEPSGPAIVKYGKNITDSEPSVAGYDFGDSFDDSGITV